MKVVDISISGIALKANRRLNIGSDYTLKLEGSKIISLRGTVVWCSLIETRKASNGEMIPIYSAGMQFKDMSNRITTELQYLIDSHKIEEVRVVCGTRRDIRFHIKDPENSILIRPDNYKVKSVSLGGMLIECQRNFKIESRIPMEMLIHDDSPLKFMGRVASCREIYKEGQKQYHTGIEFLDLTEKDRENLILFINHIAVANSGSKAEMPAGEGTVRKKQYMNSVN